MFFFILASICFDESYAIPLKMFFSYWSMCCFNSAFAYQSKETCSCSRVNCGYEMKLHLLGMVYFVVRGSPQRACMSICMVKLAYLYMSHSLQMFCTVSTLYVVGQLLAENEHCSVVSKMALVWTSYHDLIIAGFKRS